MKLLVLAMLALVAGTQAVNLVEKAEELGATTLVTLLKAAGLDKAIATGGPFTIFAPTNEAFEMLPDDIVKYLHKNKTALVQVLKYHVLSGTFVSKDLKNEDVVPSLQGDNVRINIYKKSDEVVISASGRKVVKADEMASNGVIHVIDQVLLPPPGSVVDLVKRVPDFSTLLTAVKAADLADVLAGKGPFTVFAPTNKAFEKIPKDELEALLADKEKLTAVLKYHVVAGTLYSLGIEKDMMVPTLEGSKVEFSYDDKGIHLFVNKDSMVIHPDVSVTNGVVLVIDTVLMPPKDYRWSEEAQKIFNDPHLFFD